MINVMVERPVHGGPADGETATVVLDFRRFVAVRFRPEDPHRFIGIVAGGAGQPYYEVRRADGALVYQD